MQKKIELKIMRCPTCGADLKVGDPNETLVCVYCGNEITPVMTYENKNSDMSVRVEGIKTSSSALAYLEIFFEDYDWSSFMYGQDSLVCELQDIADSLKSSCADDKNTWFFCFKSECRPYIEKCIRCNGLLREAIEEHKKDNFDAYSKFDSYKRIVKSIREEYDSVVSRLKKYIGYAKKYGATAEEIASLEREIPGSEILDSLKIYERLEAIPEIADYTKEKNQRIVRELEQKGINGYQEYKNAVSCIKDKKYAEALNILTTINGYLNSADLIKKIDKLYNISDVIEIEGVLYLLKKDSKNKKNFAVYNLYPATDGKVSQEPVVKRIKSIITNYADHLYYIDEKETIRCCDLGAKQDQKIDKKLFSSKTMQIQYSTKKAYLFTIEQARKSLYELDLAKGSLKCLAERISSFLSYNDGKFAFTASAEAKGSGTTEKATFVLDTDSYKTVKIGTKKIEICGYIGNSVVFTRPAPDSNNKNLYIKKLEDDTEPLLLEANIYNFCDIIAGKIYYYVGSNSNQILININPDKTQRKEISLYLRSVLFEQAGWIYFVRGYGYNTVICKSRVDGSQTSVICSDIEEFVKIENGYLYYINSSSSLVKVRMDGTNCQTLCSRVDKVLSIDDEKIIYVSLDRVTAKDVGAYSNSNKTVKSIYAADFKAGGRMKLAYDIIDAKEYDKDYIYYMTKGNTATTEVLKRLSTKTNESETLLNINREVAQTGCYVATCVYGSYDCPEVWTLRRFRDNVLALTWYGRLFIYLYYLISPTVVRIFGETGWFKSFWKIRLDRMVKKLLMKGIENTPYNDKVW